MGSIRSAQLAQAYTSCSDAPICGNCDHRVSNPGSGDRRASECALGHFQVFMTGTCDRHQASPRPIELHRPAPPAAVREDHMAEALRNAQSAHSGVIAEIRAVVRNVDLAPLERLRRIAELVEPVVPSLLVRRTQSG